ncbi:hypothetical protein [Streptomyces sp. NPDC054961]
MSPLAALPALPALDLLDARLEALWDGADVRRRAAGSLLEEFRSRRCPWNAAALRLLNDVYAFVGTGPRPHEDWVLDVLAVLHRSVRDPRGWLRLDRDRTGAARSAVPAYPFAPPAASAFRERVHPLEAEAAVGAVAVMAEEWQSEPAPVRSRPDRDAVLADARTLLDRYGPTARYWTNATAAASDPPPPPFAGEPLPRSCGRLAPDDPVRTS